MGVEFDMIETRVGVMERWMALINKALFVDVAVLENTSRYVVEKQMRKSARLVITYYHLATTSLW